MGEGEGEVGEGEGSEGDVGVRLLCGDSYDGSHLLLAQPGSQSIVDTSPRPLVCESQDDRG